MISGRESGSWRLPGKGSTRLISSGLVIVCFATETFRCYKQIYKWRVTPKKQGRKWVKVEILFYLLRLVLSGNCRM
jgi:hypothetical protein